jgi:hypothetical protein
MPSLSARAVLAREQLPSLFAALRDEGYRLVGPTVRDGAIVHADIASVEDLPIGWTESAQCATTTPASHAPRTFCGFASNDERRADHRPRPTVRRR